ncbi:N-6 DNA methylase [Shewanella gaetbuli]|uniref:site-specific DNA-methyltransferase (adenine-specific) n=1 Tax=Shewanella gaetbuli TaxID=220752 RepID=A0A9X1ZT45_9GAMM|nr:N-6 DNA methylase [Shewanella gaetbuli]MCL1143593.1 N-6 DNA methylase [Shewanella gaetbuli]
MAKARSIEEQVEDIAKKQLDDIGYFTKTEDINSEIDNALMAGPSKSGGSGRNFPDIKLLIDFGDLNKIPVMIEVKGSKGKLIKTDKDGGIENKKKDMTPNFSNIQGYAVNGAVHYAETIISFSKSFKEVIAIGINGYQREGEGIVTEYGVYYLSSENLGIPKKIADYSDLSFLNEENLDDLKSKIENIGLSEDEIEAKAFEYENQIETKLKALNQVMQDDLQVSVGSRVEIVAGLIMAGLGVKDVISPLQITELKGEKGSKTHDGCVIINKIDSFLEERKLPVEKKDMIINDLSRVFIYSKLWEPKNGESKLKRIYIRVYEDIIPIFNTARHLDFTGKLFNVLNEWVDIPDSDKNDVVLTPRYITQLMAKLALVNKDSYVWDYATGSAGFLISSMKLMIQDAQERIKSKAELDKKVGQIKSKQLLGIEKRSDIYMLAVLNMILMGDGSSNILHKDSLKYRGIYEQGTEKDTKFPANVFLLNPPYSTEGKGFIFVKKALNSMTSGRAVVLIQENAGGGYGLPYTKEILEKNTLVASVKLADIFKGKAAVQTAIYVFDVGIPHNTKKIVKFIDFTNDGYLRLNKKKSNQSRNLRDTGNAIEKYEEVANLVLFGASYLNLLDKTEYIEDTISLNGDDWTFSQHVIHDSKPDLSDFEKCIGNFLSWKINQMIMGKIIKQKVDISRLTAQENEAIKAISTDNLKYCDVEVKKLFEVKPTKTYGLTNPDLYRIKGTTPVLSNASVNNGIGGYNGMDTNEKGGILTFSDTTIGAETIFYQPFDFIGYSHVQGMYPLDEEKWTEDSLLYFVVALKKASGDQFDFNNKFTRQIVNKIKVKLPINNKGEIDFVMMENLVRAIKKDSLKGIV